MTTITVAAQKGGVGKTSQSRELAARLAQKYNVAIANADMQKGSISAFLGMKNEPGMADILLTDNPIDKWLRQVPRDKWATPEATGSLFIIPSDESLAMAGFKLLTTNPPLTVLRDKYEDAFSRGVVDFIIQDTAPGTELYSPWLYAAADKAVIPLNGALSGILGAHETTHNFQVVSVVTNEAVNVEVMGYVPNAIADRTNVERGNWASMKRMWPNKVWPVIRFLATWRYAEQFGQALTAYAPDSDASMEMQAVFNEFMKQLPIKERG